MNQVTNINEIRALIEKGAQFFVGHSGGKDSQAMFAILSELDTRNAGQYQEMIDQNTGRYTELLTQQATILAKLQ